MDKQIARTEEQQFSLLLASKQDGNTKTSYRQKEFVLNIDKALAKKIEAAKQEANIKYEFTGRGVTGTMDAITFELMKCAICHYFNQYPVQDSNIKITEYKDKKGLVLTKIIRVQINNKHRYTLSLYYTTCRLLVNGKYISQFITEDFPNIHNTIQHVVLNGNKIDIKSLNEQLETHLNKLKESHANDITSSISNNNSSARFAVTDSRCPKCKRNVQTRGVYCSYGQHWIHYICDRLSKSEIENIEQLTDNHHYRCKACSPYNHNEQSIDMRLIRCD